MISMHRQAYTGTGTWIGRRVVFNDPMQEATVEGVLDGVYVLRLDTGETAYVSYTTLVGACWGVSPDSRPQ